jgi:citrate lyase beta subunit
MVSDQDRAKMQRFARDLANSETNDRGTPQQRQRILESINADRQGQGLEPLTDRAPEEGLYERARTLGMARVDR